MLKTSILVFFIIWNGVLSYDHIDRFRRKIPEGKIGNHLQNVGTAGFNSVIVHSSQSDKEENSQSVPAAYSTASFHQYIPGRGQYTNKNEKLNHQPDTGQIRVPSAPVHTNSERIRIQSAPVHANPERNWNLKSTVHNPQNIQQVIYNPKHEMNKQVVQPNQFQNDVNHIPLEGNGAMVHENKYMFGQQLKFDEFGKVDETDPELRMSPEKRESSFSENKIITAKKYQYSYAMEDGDVGGVPTKPKYVSHKKYMYMKVNSKDPDNKESSPVSEQFTEQKNTPKSTFWQKIGPNVEFTPSLEAATIDYPPWHKNQYDSEENLGLRDRRRNILRGTEDQALYFANQFPDEDNSFGRDNFDHDHVLSQSNKFDISNAIIPEGYTETGHNPLEEIQTNYQDISTADITNDFQNLKDEIENENPNTYDNFESSQYLTKEEPVENNKEYSSGYGLRTRNPNGESDYYKENYYENYENKRTHSERKAPSYSYETFRSPTFSKSNKYFQKGQLRPNVKSHDDDYYLNRRNSARHYYSVTPKNDDSFPYRFENNGI